MSSQPLKKNNNFLFYIVIVLMVLSGLTLIVLYIYTPLLVKKYNDNHNKLMEMVENYIPLEQNEVCAELGVNETPEEFNSRCYSANNWSFVPDSETTDSTFLTNHYTVRLDMVERKLFADIRHIFHNAPFTVDFPEGEITQIYSLGGDLILFDIEGSTEPFTINLLTEDNRIEYIDTDVVYWMYNSNIDILYVTGEKNHRGRAVILYYEFHEEQYHFELLNCMSEKVEEDQLIRCDLVAIPA